jgi:hypothetical protein
MEFTVNIVNQRLTLSEQKPCNLCERYSFCDVHREKRLNRHAFVPGIGTKAKYTGLPILQQETFKFEQKKPGLMQLGLQLQG